MFKKDDAEEIKKPQSILDAEKDMQARMQLQPLKSPSPEVGGGDT